MASPEVIQQRIDEIDTLLAGGVTEVRYGDRARKVDLQALRDERTRLQAQLSSNRGGFRRVVFKT